MYVNNRFMQLKAHKQKSHIKSLNENKQIRLQMRSSNVCVCVCVSVFVCVPLLVLGKSTRTNHLVISSSALPVDKTEPGAVGMYNRALNAPRRL